MAATNYSLAGHSKHAHSHHWRGRFWHLNALFSAGFCAGGVQVEADDYFWIPTSPPFTTKRDPAARLSSVLCDLRAQEATLPVLKKSFAARAMPSKFSGSWPLQICGVA